MSVNMTPWLISFIKESLIWAFINRHLLCTYLCTYSTLKSRFEVKSRFKVQNLGTEMEFHIRKSQFSEKSRFKESNSADGGHSLNRDFTVHLVYKHTLCKGLTNSKSTSYTYKYSIVEAPWDRAKVTLITGLFFYPK